MAKTRPASARLSPGLFILHVIGQRSIRNGSGQPTAKSPYPVARALAALQKQWRRASGDYSGARTTL
jgi:hypothetical protein